MEATTAAGFLLNTLPLQQIISAEFINPQSVLLDNSSTVKWFGKGLIIVTCELSLYFVIVFNIAALRVWIHKLIIIV